LAEEKKLSQSWVLREFLGGPVVVWLAGLIYSVPIVFLAYRLGGVSESMTEWGQFGDYVGGLVNPLFGLITIILLVFTLKQNDLALQQSAEELQQTRDALSRGQAIQEATEKALRKQIEIASSEKDFNSAIQLSAIFDEQISQLNHYEKVSAARTDPELTKKIDIKRAKLLEKHSELHELADLGYESLVERMLRDSKTHYVPVTGKIAGRFEFVLRYNMDTTRVVGVVSDLHFDRSYSINFPALVEDAGTPLFKRVNSMAAARSHLASAIAHFNARGDWANYDVIEI